jgi:predicted metalloprotease with PDZ domain
MFAKYGHPHLVGIALLMLMECAPVGAAAGGATVPAPIRISVDATDAGRKVLHAQLDMPISPGPVTLYYPKWLPSDHSPDGPIANLTDLEFFAGSRKLPWHRDLEDMYTFHLDVPQGVSSLHIALSFLLSAPGHGQGVAANGSANLLVLMWNDVVLYPKGIPAHASVYRPSLRLPPGWQFKSALPAISRSNDTIVFADTPLDLLVDSPVQSGRYMTAIPLVTDTDRAEELDVAADDPWALEIPPDVVSHYKRLIAEARALYKSYHYRDYRFLLTLSDNVQTLGQEHHESSDDRAAEHTLIDPNARLLFATVLPHEYTHSWNGKYRRPADLATPDFEAPMRGDLLWVYEGLTEFLGTVLTARSGLMTPGQWREHLAALASTLDHRAGRSWRSLQDTADSAQVLYFSPVEWSSARRGIDFYSESVFLWLDVDMTIRQLSQGRKSIDDFCAVFLGGPNGQPTVSTYTLPDVIHALNSVVAFDWNGFLRQRLDYTGEEFHLRDLAHTGWRLVYDDTPNEILGADQAVSGRANYTSSLGLVVQSDGEVKDVVPNMPAAQAGLGPYSRILSIDARPFSLEELNRVVTGSSSHDVPLDLVVSNGGTLEHHLVRYHGGLRGPHLQRIDTAPDLLGALITPRSTP